MMATRAGVLGAGALLGAVAIGFRPDSATAQGFDVQAAVTAAAGAGGVVDIPAGLFVLPGLTIPSGGGITLRGAGRGRTTVKLANGANASVISCLNPTNGVEILDMTIDGNKANQTAVVAGISTVLGSGLHVENVHVKDTSGIGINAFRTADVQIIGCQITGMGKALSVVGTHGQYAGVSIHTAINAVVQGNIVTDGTDMGIVLAGGIGAQEATIANNVVKRCNYIGIATGTLGAGAAVTGNVVEGVTGNGIDLGACSDITVSGNTVRNSESGIIYDGGTRINISGNVVRPGVVEGGVYWSNGVGIGGSGPHAEGCIIANNIVSNAAGSGIALPSGNTHTKVIGNVVTNSGQKFPGQAGIALWSTANEPTRDLTIALNTCTDTQAVKTQAYGLLYVLNRVGLTSLRVLDNDFRGNAVAAIGEPNGATAVFYRDNQGWP